MINSDTKWAQGTLQYSSGSLYAYGGVTEEKNNFINLIVYSIQDNTWTLVETDGFKAKTLFIGAAYDNSIFAFPGWDQNSFKINGKTQVLNTNQTEWTYSDIEEIALVNYASTQSNELVYLFGGRNDSINRNSLLKIRLDDFSIEYLTENFDSPGSLMYSSMVVIGQNLVLFGGEQNGKKNSDLWVFNMDSQVWELIRTIGMTPSPRSHAGIAAQGDVVVVWGGQGEYELLNDFFLFNFKTKRWIMLFPESTLMPNQRYGPCVSIDLPLIYIFGGKSIDGISPMLWQYDLEDNSYTILESNTKFEPGFGQYCEIVKQGENTELFLAYGTGSIDHPIGYINSYDLSEGKWTELFEADNFKYNRSDAIVKRLANYLFVIGGQTWHRDTYKDIQVIRYPSNDIETLNDSMNISIYASAYTYVGDKIYSYGGGGVYGETVLDFQSSSKFVKISLKELCTECKIPCSPGTYTTTDGACIPCPKGKYNSKYGANNCVECPAGTENNILGASSERQCYPCQEGYYTSTTGTSQCYKCLESYNCPVGSQSVYLSNITDSITSDQPGMLKRNTAEAKRIGSSIQIAVIILGVTILLVLLFTEKTRKIIISIDSYNALHNYDLDVPMYRRKTFFGSVFTMIFIIIALILVIQTLILYFMDNLTETKRLIPIVILEDTVDNYLADFTVNVTFYNYGGECIDDNQECLSDLEVSLNMISSESYSYSCKKYQSNCIITLYCYTCEVSVESTILFAMKEKFSYSTAIGVNFSSDSSIPNKNSKISAVKAAESGTLFRGPSPTIFYFSLIPSLFEDDSGKKTGYHVTTQATPDAGTMIAPEQFSFISNQYVLLTVSRDLNALYTLRLITYTLFLLIMALIGSVVGIMNVIGGAMSFVENNFLQRKAKKERNDKNEKLMDNRKLALKNLTTDDDYTKEKI